MTRALPSLEAPPAGTECPACGEPTRLAAPLFCASCFEIRMRAREAAIKADLAAARRRARTWQLKGVSV